MQHQRSRQALALMGAQPLALRRQSKGPGLPAGARAYQARRWYKKTDHRKIAALRRFVREHSLDPRLRFFVVDRILKPAGIQQREYAKQGAAICQWVQQRIYYTNEDGEQLQAPWVTIEAGTGDCDDMAILAAALLQSIRLPWRFVLAGRYKGQVARWVEPYREDGHRISGYIQIAGAPPRPADTVPRGFAAHHIYLQVGSPPFKPQAWQSFEPTVKGAPMGHDVVMHGMIQDAHLKGTSGGGLPELGFWDTLPPDKRRPRPDSRALTRWGCPPDVRGGSASRGGADSGSSEGMDWPAFWRSVMMSVATGVVSAVLIQSILSKKRAKRRR